MPDGAILPGWPMLLDEAGACRLTSQSRRDFRALVTAGVFPPGRILLGCREPRWHRVELEAVLARLWGLDATAPAQQDAARRQAAMDAVNAYSPPPRRHPGRAPAPRPGDPKA
jgi:hypothetical protein